MDRLIISSILRKLPLKLLLIILALFWVFIFCFSSAVDSFVLDDWYSHNLQLDSYWSWNAWYNPLYDSFCIGALWSSNSNCTSITITAWDSSITWNPYQNLVCLVWFNSNSLTIKNNVNYVCTYGATNFKLASLENNICTPMSSLQCQTEYNLIPISSVDSNYCTTNNLCPSEDCPEYPDNPNIWTSNIYINDVFHPGAFNVIINIPEEIDWDYAYTNSWSNFNLDVVWYNQDQEMIQWWIDTNNYKPTSEDFTNIFTNFSNFWWLLIAALFVILVFYFIKKIFK